MTNSTIRARRAAPVAALAGLALFSLACASEKRDESEPSAPFEFAADAGAVVTGTPATAYHSMITPELSSSAPARLPLLLPDEGPIVLHIQVLLDRANFSPGIVDGRWGQNAKNALHWFKVAYRLDTAATMESPVGAAINTGPLEYSDPQAVIDQATYDRLLAVGSKLPVVATYEIAGEDVAGPFLRVPKDAYAQAKLECLCYESLEELLAEKFHTTAELLGQLNPGVDLKSAAAGTKIFVPNVLLERPKRVGQIATIAISRNGFWTQARDSANRIIHHFPSTLGSSYDPSPTGSLRVTNIARNPPFHYQPKLFADVPDSRPEAMLPPGPNSPVGVVWMALSRPHYGIHGTGSPETIGYANSHGCVRLTNWDARILSQMAGPGTRVVFF